MAVSRHERLHLCGCRIERRSCAPELSAGNHTALPSAQLTARVSLIQGNIEIAMTLFIQTRTMIRALTLSRV